MSDSSDSNAWAKIVGPCFSWAAMQRELGYDGATLAKAVEDLHALQLPTSDSFLVFPAWQVAHGALIPGLRPVLLELRAGTSHPWTWAQWLGVKLQTDGRSRADALLLGEVDRVVIEARHAATAWRQ
ncbi:hypothetical protein ACWPKO_28580 (plasmid) [Coraliomargarita sp. W4R53]